MTWQMTLDVVNCSSMSSHLEGARVSKGTQVLGNTNASGKLDLVLADTETFVIVRVHKDTFLDASASYSRSADAGTTRTMCLQPSPYGSDDPTQPGQPGQPLTGDGPCFIVTAATGSSQSEAVVRLRALRDRVRATSILGGQLIDAVYSEYEQFSPRLATEIERDVLPREAVLQAVVRPLLAWYQLAGILAFGDPGGESAAQELRDACPRGLAALVLPVLSALRRGGDWPGHTPSDVLELAPRLADFQLVPWAILDPLDRAWRSSCDELDLAKEVARWMATAPVELVASPMTPPSLVAELQVLSGFFDFEPSARRQLGERLRLAWPAAEESLERAGFSQRATRFT